jgi:hypothetical protein
LKKALCLSLCLCAFFFTACGRSAGREDFLALRAAFLGRDAALTAAVAADYGDRRFDFLLRYEGSGDQGTLTVLEPELIEGIRAELCEGETLRLQYDGALLDTGALFGAAASPIQALPLTVLALREGFVTETWRETLEGERLVVAAIDATPSGDDEKTICTVWFSPEALALRRAEISVDGYTVLTMEFREG